MNTKFSIAFCTCMHHTQHAWIALTVAIIVQYAYSIKTVETSDEHQQSDLCTLPSHTHLIPSERTN